MPDETIKLPPPSFYGVGNTEPDKKAPVIKMEPQPGWRNKAATSARVLGSMGGSLLATEPGFGTLAGMGLAGGGEAIAQLLEEGKINPTRVGIEAGLAAIPGGTLVSKGRPYISALKGAGIAQLGNSLRRWSQGGSILPEKEDLGRAVIGGIIGGTVGKFTKAPINPSAAASTTEALTKEFQANLEQAKPATEPKLVSNKTQGLIVTRPEVKVTQPTRGAASVEMTGEGQVDSPAIQEAKRRALKPPTKGAPRYSPIKEALYNSGVEADKLAEATREAHRAAAANQQKTSLSLEKTHEAANKLRSSEEVAAAKAQQVAAKLAQNEANAARIKAAIESGEMTPQPPSISETVSADVDGAKQRMSTQFVSADDLAEEAAAADAKAAKAAQQQQAQQAKAETAAKKQALAQEAATAKTRATLEKEAAKTEKGAAVPPARKPGDLISGFFNQLDTEQAAAKAASPTGAAPVVEATPATRVPVKVENPPTPGQAPLRPPVKGMKVGVHPELAKMTPLEHAQQLQDEASKFVQEPPIDIVDPKQLRRQDLLDIGEDYQDEISGLRPNLKKVKDLKAEFEQTQKAPLEEGRTGVSPNTTGINDEYYLQEAGGPKGGTNHPVESDAPWVGTPTERPFVIERAGSKPAPKAPAKGLVVAKVAKTVPPPEVIPEAPAPEVVPQASEGAPKAAEVVEAPKTVGKKPAPQPVATPAETVPVAVSPEKPAVPLKGTKVSRGTKVKVTAPPPEAQAETAAKTVKAQVEHVVDLTDAKTGAAVKERVVNTLNQALPDAAEAAGFKSISARTVGNGKYAETVIEMDGKPVARVDHSGNVKWDGHPDLPHLPGPGGVNEKGVSTPELEIKRLSSDLTPKAREQEALTKVAAAVSQHQGAGQITLRVPGDGTFTVERNPHAIQTVMEKMQKSSPGMWKVAPSPETAPTPPPAAPVRGLAVAPKAAPSAAAQLAEKLAAGQAQPATSVNPRTAALQSTLEALPPDHPVVPLIKAEMAAGEAYGQAKAAAEGAPKGSPESAASRRAGVEARLAREATDAALTKAGMEPIVTPKVTPPVPTVEGEVIPGPEAKAPTPDLPVQEGKVLGVKATPVIGKLVKKLVTDESGQVAPAMAVRMGTTAAGALLGYMTDPLGDPVSSALVGGAAGFAAGLGITRENTPGLAQATSGPEARAAIAAKLDAVGSKILHTLPDYQRFSYLSNLQGLFVNGVVGPYGSAIMGALEHIAQGDPRGYAALKMMSPTRFLSYMQQVSPEAEDILLKAEGHLDQGMVNHVLVAPGKFLTMGDLAAERILIEAGFDHEEAARMLLKNEPLTATGLNIAHFPVMETEGGKRALLLKLALPFKRTLANYFEQGLERTPGIGYFAQKAKDIPDSFAAQAAQQGIGGVTWGIGFVLGTMFPVESTREVGKEQAASSRETANLVRKTISNFAGPYGLPTTMGFAAGQAFASNKAVGKSMLDSVTRSAPMPSLDYIGSLYDAASSIASGEAEDPVENLRRVGVVPSFFSQGMRDLLGAGVGAVMGGGQEEQTPGNTPAIPFIQAPTVTPPNINIP